MLALYSWGVMPHNQLPPTPTLETGTTSASATLLRAFGEDKTNKEFFLVLPLLPPLQHLLIISVLSGGSMVTVVAV
jgi:hypothetical protein